MLHGDARLEMRKNREVSCAVRGVHGEGDPHLRVVWEIEAARHHPNDAIATIVDAHRLIQRRRRAAVTLVPQSKADQRDAAVGTLLFLLRGEVTPEKGLHL